MAGRVIEIRLSSPVPTLLQLLAQPELALARGVGGSGDMLLDRDGADRGAGDEAARGARHSRGAGLGPVRPRRSSCRPRAPSRRSRGSTTASSTSCSAARIDALPLADTGPLSRGTVRLDPALGLFGLHVRRAQGLLATAQGREAIAMALDRPALIEPFNIGGWVPTTRVVAPGLPADPGHDRRALGRAHDRADRRARRRAASPRGGAPTAAARRG